MKDKIHFGINDNNEIIDFSNAYKYKKDETIIKDTIENLKKISGNGTYIDKQTLSLKASEDGYLRVLNNKIFIDSLKIINSDYNLTYKEDFYSHSLWIKGDVLSGALLNVGGNLQIDGTVENVTIVCHGNIIINGNIFGQGKGKIIAKGDIVAKSCIGGKLISYGSIILNEIARHSNIYSKNFIKVLGKGEVFDGIFYAKDFIEAKSIGSKNIVETNVSVGYNFRLRASLDNFKENLKKAKINFLKNKETLLKNFKEFQLEKEDDYINMIMHNIDNISEKELYYLKALENIKLLEIIRIYSKKIESFPKNRLSNINAFIKCDTIFPGVTINILDKKIDILNKLENIGQIDRSSLEKWQQ